MKCPVFWSGFRLSPIGKGETPRGEYSALAVERVMKIQEVILRAINGQILWMQAADIGISDQIMKRWKRWYEEF
jgi:hypothetical protein